MNGGLLRWGCLLLLAAGLPAHSQQSGPATAAAASYRIAGVVLNSTNAQPIAGASVGIAPTANAGADTISRTFTTGTDGRFWFAGLPRGKYSLVAAARGFRLQSFEYHDNYATAVAVGPELDAEHLVFRLEPDAAVEGQVTDDSNEPIQNATVRLFERGIADGRQKTVLLTQSQTDDRGHYHIGHLSPGTYYLAVSARPWYAQNAGLNRGRGSAGSGSESRDEQDPAALDVTYPLTFYPNASDSGDASPIVLKAGDRIAADIVLHAVPSLTVRINVSYVQYALNSSSVVRARVLQRIFEGYMDTVLNVQMGGAGRGVSELSGLAPGHYILEVSGLSGPEGKSRSWYKEVDLVGDTELNANDASSFATVSGSVLFQNAPSVPRNSFILLSNPVTRETFRSAISEKGQFDFRADGVKPGRYYVLLKNGHGFSLSKLAATGAEMSGRALQITGAGSVTLRCVASRGIAQVTGTALRGDKPFAGAMIVLVPQDVVNNAPLVRRDQSDSDGTFTLPNVVPGQYTVLAIEHGWNLEWANPVALQPYLKGGQPVQVTGEGKIEVKVQVQ